MKRWLTIGIAALVLLLLCAGLWAVRQVATTSTELLAKQLCSLVFVTGLDADVARNLGVKPRFGLPHSQFKHKILNNPKGVEVSGLTQVATAQYRQGYGCTLQQDIDQLAPVTEVVTVNRQVEGVNVQVREQYFDPSALEAALSRTFEEPNPHQTKQNRSRQTLAVAIRYRGALIAERYAPGLGPTTALPGRSMATSVTTTLAGMLQHQGLINTTDTALFNEWPATDNRRKISLDHLLRMLSGIDLPETGSGSNAHAPMLFHHGNSAAYALAQGLDHLPGKHWFYSGGNTNLAAHYLTQKAGGYASMYTQIRTLFDTLGMHSAVLEPDASGTFLGSSSMFASARDWSKLGQLYLQEGLWQERRLLPEGWVEYVTSKTTVADPRRRYGAGFWLADDPSIYSQNGVPALPGDTFSAHGKQNQAMHIIPSEELVVVRLGATRDYWQSGEWDLVSDVIAARRP